MRIEVHKTDDASTSGLGKVDRNKAVACANIVDFVAGEPKRRFWCRHAVHTVGIRNFDILEMRVCTRPVSVIAKHAIPDTEKKSGRVQLSKDHAKRHVDVSTIKMYKLGSADVSFPLPPTRREFTLRDECTLNSAAESCLAGRALVWGFQQLGWHAST